VGPSIGGMLIAAVGWPPAFCLTDCRTSRCWPACWRLRRGPGFRPPRTLGLGKIREGIAYVTSETAHCGHLSALRASRASSHAGCLVLLPIVARNVLGRGAVQYGLDVDRGGVGALSGALAIATWPDNPQGRVMVCRPVHSRTAESFFHDPLAAPGARGPHIERLRHGGHGAIANTSAALAPDSLRAGCVAV